MPLYHNCSELVLCDRIRQSFFEMVWEASRWDFTKKVTTVDGKQNKYEEVCEPRNALCTSKLKEVMQAGRDAFTWQTRQDTVKAQKGANFDQWLKSRQIALRPLLWEVCCDAYTRFKSSYEVAHDGKPCFSVRRLEFDQGNWGPSRGSAGCNDFARQGAVIPFTTYTHTLKHTNRHRCQGRLWVLRKSDTIEARVHDRLKTSSRWKNGVEVVQLIFFEETINWNAY